MQTRHLGRNGPRVSAIGLGALSFSDFYGPTTDEASHAIMDAARDLGITSIDTSNVYGMGRSETVIGQYFARNGGRDGFHIATKAGIARDNDGRRRFDNSPEYLGAELDGSLRRLGIDTIDLFYIHRRETERPIEEVTETLAGFVKAGKIRSFGFSEIAPASLRRAAAVHPVAAVQSEYSLTTRAPELGLVQACAELGTALVAFSPVGRGLLTDSPPTAQRVKDLPFLSANPRFVGDAITRNLAVTDRFRALAAEMGTPAAALAIAWLLARGDHIHPIPGTRSVAHLRDLAAGADLTLGAADLARIETALPVGSLHGDRYSAEQWAAVERYS